MTDPGQSPRTDEEDDHAAAEFALGVLSGGERAEVARRVEIDSVFARRVGEWERHFQPLAGGYSPEPPPLSVKAAIDSALFGKPQHAGSWWDSLRVWQSATALLGALLIVAVGVIYEGMSHRNETLLLGSLAADTSDVRYTAVYDETDGALRLQLVSGAAPSERDFELWLINGDRPPVSLGVIPKASFARVPVQPALQSRVAAGALLAVSIEPVGGSPTGAPTGPVVSAGELQKI